jgi:predicted transcriptional regulator
MRIDKKSSGAFAAELLALARAVASSLEVNPEAASQEDLDRVAEQFNASPWVVAHKVENQLLDASW